MKYFTNMLDNFSDRLVLLLGASTGFIISNISAINDMLIKLVCTVVFSAIGAVVAFFVKRILENHYKPKNKKR